MITGVARAAQHSSLAQQLPFGLEEREFLSLTAVMHWGLQAWLNTNAVHLLQTNNQNIGALSVTWGLLGID